MIGDIPKLFLLFGAGKQTGALGVLGNHSEPELHPQPDSRTIFERAKVYATLSQF